MLIIEQDVYETTSTLVNPSATVLKPDSRPMSPTSLDSWARSLTFYANYLPKRVQNFD